MSGEMELDPKALLAARYAYCQERTGNGACRDEEGPCPACDHTVSAVVRAYLEAAGLVSVPVIGRKG